MKKTSFEENMTNFEKRMMEMHARAELADSLRSTIDSWNRWDRYEHSEDSELVQWQVESNQKLDIKIELVSNFINQLLA